MEYLIGQKVVVYDFFIGRVTQINKLGIWVQPLVEHMSDIESEGACRQFYHSCYARHNVRPCKADEV
jgi:hypothetical protein